MFLSAFASLYLNYTTRATFTRLSSPPREYIVDVWYWEKWKENENEWNQPMMTTSRILKFPPKNTKPFDVCWGSETIWVESAHNHQTTSVEGSLLFHSYVSIVLICRTLLGIIFHADEVTPSTRVPDCDLSELYECRVGRVWGHIIELPYCGERVLTVQWK